MEINTKQGEDVQQFHRLNSNYSCIPKFSSSYYLLRQGPRAAEIAQLLLQKSQFNSQNLHGDSQPSISIAGPNALFWRAGIRGDKALLPSTGMTAMYVCTNTRLYVVMGIKPKAL